jgi:two-component system sensor histidine kinase/response regulator
MSARGWLGRMRVRTRLLGLVSVLLVGIAAFVYWFFPTQLERQALRTLGDKARMVSAMTAFSVSPALLFHDRIGITEAVRGARRSPDLRYLLVLDDRGVVVNLLGRNDQLSARLLAASAQNGIDWDEAVYRTDTPILYNNRRIGTLRLGLSLVEIEHEVSLARRTTALASLAILLVGLVAAFGISTHITEPLRRMAETADRISGGDLSSRAQVRSTDEVGALARAFNLMVDFLEQAQGELAVANQQLEDRVRHRTAELTAAKEELEVARDAAETANRAKSEFLANMSHEIRTPMNAVMGMIDLALDSPAGQERREYLELARSSSESLLTIINDILDFSKVEAGMLRLDPVEFSLSESLGASLSALALRAHEKGLELALHIAPEMGDAFVGDSSRLRQVIVNLLGNAIKFTARGEVVVEVAQESATADQAVLHFVVRDTGIGIPPEQHERIFDAFAQADGSTTRQYGGTGLGLTISAKLVRLMGGRIWLESEVGRGSSFHFTASLGRSTRPLAPARPHRPDLVHQLDVLVVDDNATNRLILREMLARLGMRPQVAEDGATALLRMGEAAGAGHGFPLVLLDANMPDLDGFAVAEKMRNDPRLAGAVIMMLTSSSQRDDSARCRELGLAAYVTKPIRQGELYAAVCRALGAAEYQRAPARAAEQTEGGKPLSILLVEDNPVNQRLAVGLLAKRGHQVRVAENGKIAVDMLGSESFDLVLMDVQMPVMGGLEATRLIRERERGQGGHVPIAALTAHAMSGDRELCLNAGMDGYATKPLHAAELYSLVDQLARASRLVEGQVPTPAAGAADILERFMGDRHLLREVATAFVEHLPALMAELDQGLSRGEADVVQRAAHSLKGSVGNFGHTRSFELALRLEQIGRSGKLDGAAEVCTELHRGVEELVTLLTEFTEPAVR